MKILQINNYHFPRGGSDRYFLDLSRGLSDRGHDVRTLAPVNSRDIDTDFRGDASLRPLSTVSVPGPIDLLRFLYNPAARGAVRRVVNEFAPDIVHLHIYYGQISPSILAPIRKAGIPIIQTLHEYKIVCPAQTMLRDQEVCRACRGGRYWQAMRYRCNRGSLPRSALSAGESFLSEWLGARRHVDRFLAVSDFQKRQLVSMGLDSSKVTRLHNFTEGVSSASASSGAYFLYVGRLTNGKGLPTLLRAYKIYRDRCESGAIPLHIVGEGDKESDLHRFAEEIGIAESVHWFGYAARETLQKIYRDCRALINPSELNETFGLNNLEAMAHGRPVICSERGAFPEVVRNGIDGLVVRAGNVTELADSMCALSPERALDMGECAHERALSVFSKDAHLAALENIYALTIGDARCNQKRP